MAPDSFRTDYSRVAGLGSARDGTGHWWAQRLTAIALVPLALAFVLLFGSSLGGGYEAAIETFRHPLAALTAILFIAVGFFHLQLGLRVVIEDYVHGRRLAFTLLILNVLLCWGLAASGVFSVARIAFGYAG